MTSREFVAAEAGNRDRVILYREGLFWKAYERSAFALCTQVRAFKPTKRALKTLGGGHLVSVGFPAPSETSVLARLERLFVGPDRMVLSAARPIIEEDFRLWKASVPLAAPPKRSAGPQPIDSPASDASVPDTPAPDIPVQDTSVPVDFTMSNACRVAEALRGFSLASKTPMDCMMFIAEMQRILSAP